MEHSLVIKYYAIFEFESDGINVYFPDVPEAFTCAYSVREAILMAKEVLELTLHKKKVRELPRPTDVEVIKIKKNELLKLITITKYEREGVLYGNNIVEYD